MSILFLSLDSRKPARDARKAQIDALISAEFERVKAEHPHADRADYLARVAPLFKATPETYHYTGGETDHYPYSELAIELMKESHAIPFDQTAQGICPQCGKPHDRLWIVRRALADTFGHFPVYRLNGAEHVIDSSLPHTIDKLPRDAVAVPPSIAAQVWHATSASHGFAAGVGPDVIAFVNGALPTGRRPAA